MRRTAVVLPLLVLLAGCGAGGASSDSAGSAAAPGTVGADSGTKSASGSGQLAQPAVDKQQVKVPRSLIRTADVAVRVKDAKAASAAVVSIVTDAGGEVVDAQVALETGRRHA